MAYYAYKQVRDLLPQHIIDKQGPDYQGDGNYDGDQWNAAADYIVELKESLAAKDVRLAADELELRLLRQQCHDLLLQLSDCQEYMREGETASECIARNRNDVVLALKLLAEEKAKTERLQKAVDFLATCGAIRIVDGGTYFYGNTAAGNVPVELVEIVNPRSE